MRAPHPFSVHGGIMRRRWYDFLVAPVVALCLVIAGLWMPLGAHAAALRGASGAAAAGAVYSVGSFTKSGTTGNQTVAHGLGETPRAVIFWTSGGPETSGSWGAHLHQMLGFAAGTTNSYSVNGAAQDGVATSNTGRRMAAKAVTFGSWDGTTLWAEADLSSWDATNFVLNWTTNTALRTPDIPINFLAIGGADVQAKVVNWTSPTTAINKAVTGVGFQPDLVFHSSFWHSTLGSTAHHYFGWGAMNSAGEQWMNAISSGDALAAANTARLQRTDSCLGYPSDSAASIGSRAVYVSMDADGFTTNFPTVDGAAQQVASLCLKGVTSKVGSFAKTTAAAPASQSVNAGMEPSVVLLSHVRQIASTTPDRHAYWGLGAYDGTNQRASSQADTDGADPTWADSIFHNDAVVVAGGHSSGTPVTTTNGAATALTATGFDLSFNPNEATADEILYLALA